MANRKNLPLLSSILIALSVFVFYLNFINLSSDTIMLFLTSKIFLGKWILKGVFPLFNPHIFAGVPFGFDLGLGNFHPLNILFILPYPLSFALWTGIISFMFIFGFYLFFKQLTKTKKFAFLMTLILFFSGSGVFLRMNNPTILAVIAHYGFFLYSLQNLKNKGAKSYLFPLFWGVLMTLSGHIQFVFYGYLLGVIVGLFVYKIKFKNLFMYYLLLILLTSWYYIFSLPLVLSSTRSTLIAASTGSIKPAQLIQLILPFIFGEKITGARWNVGYETVISISLVFIFSLFLLLLKNKLNKLLIISLIVLLFLSFGIVPLPFIRNPGQIFILVHVLGLVMIANNEEVFLKLLNKSNKKIMLILGLLIIFSFLGYLFSQLFVTVLLFGYKTLKNGKVGLFFDKSTAEAIGALIGRSFSLLTGFLIVVNIIKRHKNLIWPFIFGFIIIEGLLINFRFNYFIPADILSTRLSISKTVDTKNHRIQSTSDTVPYFGFNIYIENVLFRPPFSKERPLFDKKERSNFTYLKKLLSLSPSSFSMINETKSVQGYATFVPQKIADLFNSPSEDYELEYKDIVERNPLFKEQIITHINAIDTTKTTLTDKRWTSLSVGYFLSDRPIKNYELIDHTDNQYIYQNPNAISINQLIDMDSKESITPVKETPNEMIFDIKNEDIGKKLVVNINPDGFRATTNGKVVDTIKRNFELELDLKVSGEIRVFYSPPLHLKEVLQRRKILL